MCRQSRKILENTGDIFLVQVLDWPSRGHALLNLLLRNREELMGDKIVEGKLGSSDHKMIEFRILRIPAEAQMCPQAHGIGLMSNVLEKP